MMRCFGKLFVTLLACILLAHASGFVSPARIEKSSICNGVYTPKQSSCFHVATPTKRFASPEKSNESGVPSSPLDRPVLSAIDASALTIFAGIGKASHSSDGSLDVGAVLVTALPFLVSWFVVSPLIGCFTPEATKDVKSAAIQSAKGWILAVPLGCVLRGVIKGYIPPLPFVIVTMIATLVILTAGRVGYTALSELCVEMF